MENETRTLPCPLTEEQQIELGQRLAELNINIEGKLDLKKALPKQIEFLQEEAAELGHRIKNNAEEKQIECYWQVDDPVPGKCTLYRFDTGAIVETRDKGLFDQPNELTEDVPDLSPRLLPADASYEVVEGD